MNHNVPDFPLVHPKDNGIRREGTPDECFYCKQKVGSPHLCDCVAVRQRVRVRATFQIEITVPHIWNQEDIDGWIEDENFGLELNELAEGILQDAEFISVVDPTPRIEIQTDDDQQSEIYGKN
jgi:hypothetical protein